METAGDWLGRRALKNLGLPVILLLTLMLLSACSPDGADCSGLPAGAKIKIDGAWSRAAASGSSAAYMVISNCGSEPDRLVNAASSVSQMTSVHLSEMQNGVMVMKEVKEIVIPAGKKVEFKSGGYHIMMMELQKEIKAGDVVDLTLKFANNGEIKVTAPARNP